MAHQKNKTGNEPPLAISLSRLRNVDRLKKAEKETRNRVNYYLKFYMMDLDQAFCYKVAESDWNRVSEFFRRDEPVSSFLEFADIEKEIVVHVNADYVVLHQALFDASIPQESQRAPGSDVDRVTIYLRARKEPLEFDYMDDSDINDLNDDLNWASPESMPFINFVDGDGEENSIRVDQIIVVETPDSPSEDDSEERDSGDANSAAS